MTPIAHLERLGRRLTERFDDLVVAVWAGGSFALDDVRATSDLDAAVAVERDLTLDERRGLAGALLAAAGDLPVRGLEAVVYSRGDLAEPGSGRHQVNVNGGPGMTSRVGGPDDDPSFWFVVDLAILRAAGRVVHGPAPRDLIAEVPEAAVRDALRRSLDWHRASEEEPHRTVLNACRAWHHVETRGWASKSQAARWAAARLAGGGTEAVLAAAARRDDPDAPGPSPEAARKLTDRVLTVLGADTGPSAVT